MPERFKLVAHGTEYAGLGQNGAYLTSLGRVFAMDRYAAAITEGVSDGTFGDLQSMIYYLQTELAKASRIEAGELRNSCPSFVVVPGLHPSDVAKDVAKYLTDFEPLKGQVPCCELPINMRQYFRTVTSPGDLSMLISWLLFNCGRDYVAETVPLKKFLHALDPTNTSSIVWLKNDLENNTFKFKWNVFRECPDNVVCIDNWILMYGEETPNAEDFEQAQSSLVDKVKSMTLPLAIYGDVSFLICYAAAGTRFQLFTMQIDVTQDRPFLTPLTPELNMTTQRPYLLLVYIKLHFILRGMRAAVSSGPRYDLYTRIDREMSSLQLSLQGVIWDWEDYCEEFGVNYQDIRTAYVLGRSRGSHLIGAVSLPVLTTSGDCKKRLSSNIDSDTSSDTSSAARGLKKQKTVSYMVHTVPLLAERVPGSEGELRQLVSDVLKALTVLHGSGLVHRDIRPANIMYNYKLRQYVLIDLECVCKEGLVPVVQLKCWDILTCSWGEQKYTTESDLYLVGVLMKGNLLRSEASQHLAEKLLSKSYATAAAALEDEWFTSPRSENLPC